MRAPMRRTRAASTVTLMGFRIQFSAMGAAGVVRPAARSRKVPDPAARTPNDPDREDLTACPQFGADGSCVADGRRERVLRRCQLVRADQHQHTAHDGEAGDEAHDRH
jgi:hypothetical protein